MWAPEKEGMEQMFDLDPNDLLFKGIAFLIAITVHELGHALVAYRLGDPTPKVQGRLTLNPIAHMDVLGTLMILFTPIGWAKPVQFNPLNFRGNKRVGKILTTVAGPLMNLITAILFAVLIAFLFKQQLVTDSAWTSFFQNLMIHVVSLNVILFLFNLLPIPPLDGYWILKDVLPRKTGLQLGKYEMYGPFVLLLVVVFGFVWTILGPLYDFFLGLIDALTRF